MNAIVKKFLNDRGFKTDDTYYNNIELWESYWEGKTDFHKYKDVDGNIREMYSLGMAKRIAEDWASILWNEKSEISVDNKRTNELLKEQLKEIDFDDLFPKVIEKAFYSGTGALILRVRDVLQVGETLVKGDKTRIELHSVTAEKIVPLTIENGVITEVAFVSGATIKGKKYHYVELHTKNEEGNYVIENIYLDEKGNEVHFENVLREIKTQSDKPWFVIIKPNNVNPIANNNGLGASIYAGAIDQLKAVDIAYNNFVRDFYLGGKKVFYNKSLVKMKTVNYKDETGQVKQKQVPIYPDDVTKQQFLVVGDDTINANDNPEIREYNPDLRVNDNETGVQAFLDYLAFKCDLGSKRYRFDNGSVITATQYLGEQQDLISNMNKHQKNVNKALKGIAEAILYVRKVIFKDNIKEDAIVTIINDDSFMTPIETQKEEFRNDISLGLRSKTSYLMKFYGMSEEEAQEELDRVNTEDIVVDETE